MKQRVLVHGDLQQATDILLLCHGLLMEACHAFAVRGQFQSISLHEAQGCLAVGNLLSLTTVHLLVQHLAGQVTQQDGAAMGHWLQVAQQVGVGAGPIFSETGGNGRDVHQIVWLQDNELGIERPVAFLHAHQIQLRAHAEQLAQVAPLPHSVLFVGVGHP